MGEEDCHKAEQHQPVCSAKPSCHAPLRGICTEQNEHKGGKDAERYLLLYEQSAHLKRAHQHCASNNHKRIEEVASNYISKSNVAVSLYCGYCAYCQLRSGGAKCNNGESYDKFGDLHPLCYGGGSIC